MRLAMNSAAMPSGTRASLSLPALSSGSDLKMLPMNGISMSISLRYGMSMPRLRGRISTAMASTTTPSTASTGLRNPARRGLAAAGFFLAAGSATGAGSKTLVAPLAPTLVNSSVVKLSVAATPARAAAATEAWAAAATGSRSTGGASASGSNSISRSVLLPRVSADTTSRSSASEASSGFAAGAGP